MAVDKLVDSAQLNADLTSVANAIRTKGGTSAQLAFPAGFVSAIGDISGDGGGNANVSQDANGYIVLDDAAPSGGGGGGSGPTFSEVTATSSATNARAAALLLAPNLAENKVYYIIINKPQSTWAQNQLLSMMVTGTAAQGCAIRWRNATYNFIANLADVYDVVINPGDTFFVNEADLEGE